MKRFLILVSLLTASSALIADSITIDTTKMIARVPDTLWGVFFEEINHAGEGGLYAELIQNRGFEESQLPIGCILDGGKLVPPRTPHFGMNGRVSDWTMPWTVKSDWPAWNIEATGGCKAETKLVSEHPLNAASPHSLKVRVDHLNHTGRVTVINEGFWGIGVKQNAAYNLRFFARTDDNFDGPITAALESNTGTVYARNPFTASKNSGWKEYRCRLVSNGDDPKARLVLTLGATGTIFIDFVSLFPELTFHNRTNGLRPDLAKMIADLKPAFVRWPGGCFVEGICIENAANWKKTIGPVEQRPGTYSPWGYWSTDGFGYHEFLQYCEDIGAAGLYVINCGVSCEARSGTFVPDGNISGLISDALDSIEYAIGTSTSRWGFVRAKAGHPKPFPLKYVEVGNEQGGPKYAVRYNAFYKAIKAKYPNLTVILNMGYSGLDKGAIASATKVEIADEHSYRPAGWALRNADYFDKYKRDGYKIYIGEFATNSGVGPGNMTAALNDAVYMLGVERNSDLVSMASYAPLLENVNKREWDVNLIHFDSTRAFGRASYHACKLFANNRPDVILDTKIDESKHNKGPITGSIGVGTWDTIAEFKDIQVISGGRSLFYSDFSNGTGKWNPDGGAWAVHDNAYRQENEAVGLSYAGDPHWSNYTLTLKARKLSGKEGFLIAFGRGGEGTYWWNIGGWANQEHGIELERSPVGKRVRGVVESGRWYDIKIELKDRRIRCYLDGTLIHDEISKPVQGIFAQAGRDDKTGNIILKVVNVQPSNVQLDINIIGTNAVEGTLIELTSNNPSDENSFASPGKIEPIKSLIAISGNRLKHMFPANSLSIFRLK